MLHAQLVARDRRAVHYSFKFRVAPNIREQERVSMRPPMNIGCSRIHRRELESKRF
jgi:hypothetical protein